MRALPKPNCQTRCPHPERLVLAPQLPVISAFLRDLVLNAQKKRRPIRRRFKRRGGDSNPRSGYPDTAFPVLHNRPLCHLSEQNKHRKSLTADESNRCFDNRKPNLNGQFRNGRSRQNKPKTRFQLPVGCPSLMVRQQENQRTNLLLRHRLRRELREVSRHTRRNSSKATNRKRQLRRLSPQTRGKFVFDGQTVPS